MKERMELFRRFLREAGPDGNFHLEYSVFTGMRFKDGSSEWETHVRISSEEGRLAFEKIQRRDAGDRASNPPGHYQGELNAEEATALRASLQEFRFEDLSTPVADPGGTLFRLRVGVGSKTDPSLRQFEWQWPVLEPGTTGPIDVFWNTIQKLSGRAGTRPVWSLVLGVGGVRKTRQGISVDLEFANPGSAAILLIDPSSSAAAKKLYLDFIKQRPVTPGITPLPADHYGVPAALPAADHPAPVVEPLRLLRLEGHETYRYEANFPIFEIHPELAAEAGNGTGFIGGVSYLSYGTGDFWMGRRLFQGGAFSPDFEFPNDE